MGLGAGVEMEIAKLLECNTVLRKFGMTFRANGPRILADRYIMRNNEIGQYRDHLLLIYTLSTSYLPPVLLFTSSPLIYLKSSYLPQVLLFTSSHLIYPSPLIYFTCYAARKRRTMMDSV